MASMKPKKGILLFDLDNTLFHSDAAYEVAVKKSFPTQRLFTLGRDTVKNRLPKNHVCARNRLLYFKAIFESKRASSPTKILEQMAVYENEIAKYLSRQVKSLKRLSLLKKLSQKYILGVVTNENARTQLIKWKTIDPDGKFFSVFVTSEEVGVEKPNPQIFEEAVARLPKGLPIFFIGDDIEADIIPSLSRGWKTILTTEFIKKLPPSFLFKNPNFWVIDSLNDLEKLLEII